ncbi:aldo/keto reductase [Gynuella sunshinyii]|uniref:Putative oxidoreductase (Related to aryl-alcohol dehydrogenase) n=1 Tax=Gynuella sunshinyii YC6258 TaxID=1445510 RepID=A0A0C5V9U9_9GAMM|nr:aldo/keto reductase [Gynuella sunshinyii]AJQ96130.1 putative oxidoreductase (related to aryl-alcohol dehydrogenase) [Gynuella sunshinyii YC6258]
MKKRMLGSASVTSVGLGCMNLSHAYGAPMDETAAVQLLNAALDAGYTHLDTAALYGFGNNETLLGNAIGHRRHEYFLASKCGMFKDDSGKRKIDGRPEVLKKTCEDSLQRLQTEVIDLYYLHRWDKSVPIEESVGALADLVKEGKIKAIGLSEVSSATLRKAHAVHPITALQTEYSLWTRNPEISVLNTCEQLGVTFVAFSPVARGFLGGILTDVSTLTSQDIRRAMPRFAPENYRLNLELLEPVRQIAKHHDATMAQVALAWVLQQSENIVVIPGTTNRQHMLDNLAASQLILSDDDLQKLSDTFRYEAVSGPRYNEATQAEIDTEEFR